MTAVRTSRMSFSMLPLVSSSQPEMQRQRRRHRCRRRAAGEEGDRLRLARLDQLEVLGLQPGDRTPLLVGDDHAEVDQIDAAPERLLSGRRRHGGDCEQNSSGCTHGLVPLGVRHPAGGQKIL